MAIISRHANAPFENGETLSGVDLENDFDTIYVEFNGNIDNSNIASGAAIDGSKLAAVSVANAKFIADTLTTAKMAASAVTKHHVSLSATYGAITTSQASLIDWTGITSATLTPGSTSDMIMMDLTLHYSAAANDTSNELIIGWSVDGTPYDSVIASEPVLASGDIVVHSSYAVAAPSATSIVIKPQHRYNGTQTLTAGHVIFRCFILPGK